MRQVTKWVNVSSELNLYPKNEILYTTLVGWLVGWNLTSLFSTNTAISETKGTPLFGG